MSSLEDTGISRRRLLQSATAAAAVGWLPAFRVDHPPTRADCVYPPGFPDGIELYRQGFENWAKAIVVDDLWTCAPRSTHDVVTLANWAQQQGWRLRPRGAMHNWSPICITADTSCEREVILVDTTRHLTGIEVHTERSAVRVGAGVSMQSVVTELEQHGFGFAAIPAVGHLSVAGGLAVGMHGASLPALGERRVAGHTYGSLSNLVVSFRAVVWSAEHGRFVLREFPRSHPDAKAFLVHLGRAFVTDVTLRIAPNQNLRCVSHLEVPAAELFGPPGAGGRSFQSFVDAAGRVEAIWFPFTEKPWLKVWSVEDLKPPRSREVHAPYNYPFTDNYPEQVTDLVSEILSGNSSASPTLGQVEYGVVVAGMAAFDADDIWGKSKNVLLYIRPTTLRMDELGYAVLTQRRHIQRVVNAFTSHYERRLNELRAQRRFPINGPVDIRVTGIDRDGDVGIAGSEAPALAATTPRRDRASWDTVVWLNLLTTPGTPGEYEFFRELELWMRSNFTGYAMARPEWSKGWACAHNALWADARGVRRIPPRAMSAGRRPDEDWGWARRRLNRYDPHRVFSNAFLDRLLPAD
jgi:FAD/FMN-containing dehydrogenase